jgi:hypothetical protein
VAIVAGMNALVGNPDLIPNTNGRWAGGVNVVIRAIPFAIALGVGVVMFRYIQRRRRRRAKLAARGPIDSSWLDNG